MHMEFTPQLEKVSSSFDDLKNDLAGLEEDSPLGLTGTLLGVAGILIAGGGFYYMDTKIQTLTKDLRELQEHLAQEILKTNAATQDLDNEREHLDNERNPNPEL